MAHGYLVRVMTNDRHGTLHRLLVFLGGTGDAVAAIAREKQISGGARRRKTALIDGINPDGRGPYDGLV
jgi:predicted GIY-YIG superfamily endonuclease